MSMLFSGGSSPMLLPNPSPRNYKVTKHIPVGRFHLYEIKYKDCTNFEGIKLVVTSSPIDTSDNFDPHFLEGNTVLARFRPGLWEEALAFVHMVNNAYTKGNL
jgi:hypothetical protein